MGQGWPLGAGKQIRIPSAPDKYENLAPEDVQEESISPHYEDATSPDKVEKTKEVKEKS